MQHPPPSSDDQARMHSPLTIHLDLQPTLGSAPSKPLRSGQKLSGTVLLPSQDQGGEKQVRVVGYVVIGAHRAGSGGEDGGGERRKCDER